MHNIKRLPVSSLRYFYVNYYLHTGDKAITSNKTMNPICAQDLELELLRTRPQPQNN